MLELNARIFRGKTPVDAHGFFKARLSKYERYGSRHRSRSQLTSRFFQQIIQLLLHASNKSVFASYTSNQPTISHAPKLVRDGWIVPSSGEVIIPFWGAKGKPGTGPFHVACMLVGKGLS